MFMNKKLIYHFFMILWFVSCALIVISSYNGILRYGLGIADGLFDMFIGIVVIGIGIYYIRDVLLNRNANSITQSNWLVALSCLLFIVFVILKFTVLRGPASSWDGKIFF